MVLYYKTHILCVCVCMCVCYHSPKLFVLLTSDVMLTSSTSECTLKSFADLSWFKLVSRSDRLVSIYLVSLKESKTPLKHSNQTERPSKNGKPS